MKPSEYKAPRKFLLKGFLRWWDKYQWPIVIGLAIVTVYLGFIGFSEYFRAFGLQRSKWDCFYLSLQLFVLESGSIPGPKPWHLEVARLLAPALAAYTAIKALLAIFKEQVQSFYLWFMKDHFVICGLGRKGFILAKGFQECGYHVVIIEQDEHNSHIEQCKEKGAIVLTGNATYPSSLSYARVDRAKYLFCVTGDDGSNAEISVHAFEMLKKRNKGKVLTCFVHITEPQLCNLLVEHELVTEKSDAFRLEFFNIYDRGARALLKEYPPFSTKEEIKNLQPHIVVVGLGNMGRSLVVHAARDWLNYFYETGKQLCFTIIDKEAIRKVDLLCLQYPRLKEICSFNPQQIDIRWPEFQEAGFLFDSEGLCNIAIIYICLGDSSLGLSAALTLFQKVRAQNTPIVVRVIQKAGFAKLLQGLESKIADFKNIYPFELLDRTCNPKEVLGGIHETIAQGLHEHYVLQQESLGYTPETNPSMVSWEELSEDLKESNRRQADHIGVKLKEVKCDVLLLTDWDAELFQFTPEEVEILAKMEHERWMKDLLDQKWEHGPVKDAKKKTHPDLVPWSELPEGEKEKNRNFMRSLPAILARVDLQIYRL